MRRTPVRGGLWVRWLLATALGFAVGGAMFHFPFGFGGSGFSSFNVEAAAIGGVFGAWAGLMIGILQWLVLRRVVTRAGWWIVASLAGVAAAHAVGDAAPTFIPFGWLAAFGGGAVSIVQWLFLRKLSARAILWMPAGIVSWYGGFAGGLAVANAGGVMILTGPVGWATQHALVGAVAGAVTGAFSGILLAWQLSHRHPDTVTPV